MMLTPSTAYSTLAILLGLTFHAGGLMGGESWSSFQNGGSVTDEDRSLPVEWSPERGITWQVQLAGYGQSSPVIDDHIVYVTSTSGPSKEVLYVEAFDRATGKRLWLHEAKNSSPAENSNYVSRAAPTPVCDATGVVALFEGGNLIALDRRGQTRWARDFVTDFGAINSRHGVGASLEHDRSHVYAWIERNDDPFVVAVSKETGETVWKSGGLGVTSWSSPRLVPVGEAHHLVLSGMGKIVGLDPQSGDELWEFNEISGNSTPTPIPLGNGRFLIGATEGRGESGDGRAAESNGVMQIRQDAGGKFTAEFAWRARKATSSFGSPVAHRGHAYFVNRAGVIYCLDLETGEQRYVQRTASSIWATPLAVGDRVYFFGKDGTTTVIASGSKFELRAANKLWVNEQAAPGARGGFGGPVLYAAAAGASQLILRRGDILYGIGE